MSKDHEHDLEFGQTSQDFMKKVIQMRCTKCDYSSYTFFRTWSEVFMAHPELLEPTN